MPKLLHHASQQVRDVMTANPITLRDTATVQEAALAMRDVDVGDILVLRDGVIGGILTDRDIVVRSVADGRDPRTVFIGEICTDELNAVTPDDSVRHAIELMRHCAIRRLPVVEDGSPVGMVTLGDLATLRDPHSALAEISTAPANT